mmetsp:Transcript_838/g.902  ORF Transcript_838/g.902 Transcript_838/m.902 type:complete len:315 (+) Transcript_838:114-1058(+)
MSLLKLAIARAWQSKVNPGTACRLVRSEEPTIKVLRSPYSQSSIFARGFCSDGKNETPSEDGIESADSAQGAGDNDSSGKAESKEPLFVCKFTGTELHSTEDIMRYQGTLESREDAPDLVHIPVFKRPIVNPDTHKAWIRDRDNHSKLFGLTPIDFGKHIYKLQKEDPSTWTDAALANKYHLSREKVSAIIRIREHAENWEKTNYVNPETDLDILAREVFGEFSTKEVRERRLEEMRRPPEGDSANYMSLGVDEPDFEEQRKKWQQEERLSIENPYGSKETVDEETVSVGYDERLKQSMQEKKTAKKEYVVTEI